MERSLNKMAATELALKMAMFCFDVERGSFISRSADSAVMLSLQLIILINYLSTCIGFN